ncbi:MAG: BPSS1780 family membrane protein [Sulfurifustaceae bacterium]
MDPRSVDASRGAAWFGGGWRIFAKNPGMWLLLTIVLVVLVLVLGVIPLGGLAIALLAPVIGGGLLYGAAELEAGRPLEIKHLWQGFKDPARLTPLLGLGAVTLAAGALSLLIVAGFVGGTMEMMAGGGDPMLMPLDTRGLLALLLALTVQLAATILIYFAVPLAMFRAVPAMAAMRSSVRACARNVLPLFVFSLIYFFAAIVASVPFGLGWLVLLPWSIGMLYCSYVDIYPASSAGG